MSILNGDALDRSVPACREDCCALAKLHGRFILSINDVPEIRRLFQRFRIEAVATTYTIAGGKRSVGAGGQACELVISGPIRSRR